MNLEGISSLIIPLIIHMLEAMGVFIIALGGLKAFGKYALRFFDFSNDNIKLEFARALALGLEFKMGAEILKTLMVRTLDELIILASIVILRFILTFVIHWEISSATEHCNLPLENENNNVKSKADINRDKKPPYDNIS